MKFIDFNLKAKNTNLRHKSGDAFRTAFDENYGILYIDLKMISGACGW